MLLSVYTGERQRSKGKIFSLWLSIKEPLALPRLVASDYNDTTAYLTQEEVHIVFDENLDLFTELLLHGRLALAAQVGRGLGDSSQGKGVTLAGHLVGEITRCLVDRLAL